MITRLLIAASLLSGSALAAPAPRTVDGWHFRATDLFALKFARTPMISPDGKTVAYVQEGFRPLSDERVRSLWLIDVSTGRARQVGGEHQAISPPTWTPDGRRLAYCIGDKDGTSRIAVTDVEGEGTNATHAFDVAEAADGLAWSRDGRHLAFTRFVAEPKPPAFPALSRPQGVGRADPIRVFERPDFVDDRKGYARDGWDQLFVLDPSDGTVHQRTSMGSDVGDPAWGADEALYFSARPNGSDDAGREDTELWALSADGSAPVRLTRHDGPDGSPTVSPDGRWIAFIGSDDRRRMDTLSRLYVMSIDGNDRRPLSGGVDRSVEAPSWSADGKAVLAQFVEGGRGRILMRMSLDGRMSRLASGVTATQVDRPYVSEGAFSVANDGTVAFAQTSPDRPLEVAIARGGRIRRLTDLNGKLLAGRRLAAIRPLEVRSPFDGRRIEAWIMLPADARPGERLPAILENHGGPQTAYGAAWGSQFQLYAAAGYAVVFANYRGSAGYGQAFEDLIEEDFPGHAVDDMQGAIDAAIEAGYVDPHRLFVAGGSAGGAITASMIGRTKRFNAAAVVKPLIDARSIALTSDLSRFWLEDWFRAAPWEDPARYDRMSPLTTVGSVTTPTVLIVGERDRRTPVSEALQFYRALQSRRIPTALAIVPDRGHFDLADRPSQLADQTRLILAWFARYGGPPVPEE